MPIASCGVKNRAPDTAVGSREAERGETGRVGARLEGEIAKGATFKFECCFFIVAERQSTCSTQRTHRSSAASNPPAGASNRFSPRQIERLSITLARKTRIKRVGRRETGRSLPSTTKSLHSRQTNAIHQVNL